MAQSSPQKEALIQSLTNTLKQKGVFNKCVSLHLREIASQIESNSDKQISKKKEAENQSNQQFVVDFIASYLDKNHLFDQLTTEEINDPTLYQKISDDLANGIDQAYDKQPSSDPFNNFFQIMENRLSPKGKNDLNDKSKRKKTTKKKKINKKPSEVTESKIESQYDLLEPKMVKRAIQPHLGPQSARASSPMRYTFGLRSPSSPKSVDFDEKADPSTKQSNNKKNSSHDLKDKNHKQDYYNYNPTSSSKINESGVIEVTPQPIFINRKKSSKNDQPQVVNLEYEISFSRDPLPGTSGDVNEPSVIVSPRKKIKSNKYSDNLSSSSSSPETIKEEIIAYIPPQSPKVESPKERQISNFNTNYNNYNGNNNYNSNLYNSNNSNSNKYNSNYYSNDYGSNNYNNNRFNSNNYNNSNYGSNNYGSNNYSNNNYGNNNYNNNNYSNNKYNSNNYRNSNYGNNNYGSNNRNNINYNNGNNYNNSNYDSNNYSSNNYNSNHYNSNNNNNNNANDTSIKNIKVIKRRKKVLKQRNPAEHISYNNSYTRSPGITERSANYNFEPQSYSNSTTQTTFNVATQTTEDCPTLLKISVIEAEVRGTSDGEAYACFIQMNEEEKGTRYNRSRKPQWKKNMSFMVPNIFSDELFIKVVEKTDDDDQYVISSLTIPLKKVALDDEIDQWFEMESDISKRDGGRIHLKMSAASINNAPS
ncbi:hypothetical protein M9Y10_002453 [Tritrichomonas musculus]|uniref:C2 domain-containing protein n=1 Tax=Tritrichomonas musculus TaxID=1915356 RepID=A0ABR2L9U2_9EUKA